MSDVIDSYDLSPLQQGMLFHAVSEKNTGVDIEQIVITLREPFDPARFMRAWQEVIQRHTILRTRFRWEDMPEPRQEVVAFAELPLTYIDWRELSPAIRDQRFAEQLAADRRQDFDLAQAPLMRLLIARLATDEYRIVWTFHHALLDGRSFPLVLREVFSIHEASQRGTTAQLGAATRYRDYIEWRRSLDFTQAEAHWRTTLSGFHAPTPFGVDCARSDDADTETSSKPFGATQVRLSIHLTTQLRAAANAAAVTVNTMLQAAWALLLQRYSGESDIVFGATRAGRRTGLAGSETMIGLFINTLPLRVRVDGNQQIVPWLQALRAQQTGLRAFEHTPLATVQSWSDVPRGTPLFESLVVYEHSSLESQLHSLGEAWRSRRFQYIGQTNFPLTVVAYGDDEMLLRLEYSRRRFSDAAIERMLGHLKQLLAGLAEGKAAQLKDLDMLTAAERAELLGAVPGSYASDVTLHERFEQQAARTPNAVALISFGADESRRELSYAELNRLSNALAYRLRERGVRPNELVALRTERTADVVIGILAILKAGAAYLPLDPVYPHERIAFMIQDAQVRIVLTHSALQADLAGIAVTVVCLDEPLPTDARQENLPALSGAQDLAYVIYTSGSTGKPKAVRITHRNVMRLFAATEQWFGFNERDVWTLFHSYAFDFSVWELWGALLYGGRVVVVSMDTSRNTEAFRELLLREAVTVLNQTPTAFRQLIDIDRAVPPGAFALRYVIFGGEALELHSLKPWFDRYGEHRPRLINMYGITETTVHVTYRPITSADLTAHTGSVIGVPIPDLRVYVLDQHGQLCPLGVPGEMHVAGAGVALGYLNRPELSAQRFVPDPFSDAPETRMYRSGDLARRLPDGELEYLGRIDQQVKIRGFRIELGEIEAVIAQHPAVRQVAVIDRQDAPGEKRLVAYIVTDQPHNRLIEELRQRLRRTLPDYMTPAHFIFVNALQLTHNGKLDRRALPAPDVTRAASGKPFIAPRNAIEQAIAEVWKAVLHLDRVGVDDHFFELGGDSILSIQVIARCRQQGLRLTPKDLFKRPTVAQLAEVVAMAPTSTISANEPVSGTVALTPIQQWFFTQQFAQAHHWNQAFLFEVAADFDPAALQQALHHVIRHHDALRLRYTQQAGSWLQHYAADNIDVEVQCVDLSQVAPDRQASAITQHAAHAQAQFDLTTGPLMCVVHFDLGPAARGRLLIAVHHLIVDGVSWRMLREDLESAYLAIVAGKVIRFADKTSSMQAWAARLNEYAQTAAVHDSLSYWRATSQARAAALPPDVTTHTTAAPAAAKVAVRLSGVETRALLQQLPAVFRTQINDVLLSALVRALQRRIGGGAFRIDLEGHGREHLADDLDVSRTMGWFTTLFPLALEVAPDADILDMLLAVRDQLRQVPHRGMSYGLLRHASLDASVRDSLATAPASSVLFNYLGQFDAVVADSELFSFASESTGPWRSPAGHRTHALEIIGIVRDGQLEIEWHYDSTLHQESTIARAADDMTAALREILALANTSPVVPLTPADFPLAGLDRTALASMLGRYPQVQDIYPLTPMQRLFFTMETAQANLGFEQWHFRIDGRIEAQCLRRAVEYVIARHSILRTAFVAEGSAEPLQVVLQTAALPWSEEDWRDVGAAEQEARIAALLQSDAGISFDLAQAPAMRVALRRVGDNSWHFVWSTHHLCIDGWSWPLVLKDVSRAYAALQAGATPALETAIPFRDYVEWLAVCAPRSEDFWRSELKGISAPTPFKLSPVATTQAGAVTTTDSHFHEVVVSIAADVTAALQTLARNEQLTLSVVVNGAWSLLLSHYSAASDVVFGAAFSGRPTEIRGIESMVGPCVNNLPVRVGVTPADTLVAWLARLQQRQFDIAQHQYAPLEQIQQWAGIPWRHRLFDSLIVFQNYQVDAEARRMGPNAGTTLLAAPQATNYALTLAVTVQDALHIRLIYQRGAFDAADVEQFAADLTVTLRTMAQSPTIRLADILRELPPDLHGKANMLAATKTPARSAAYSAPSSDAERMLATLWQELFAVERVSLDDNFFDLGGHSLLLVRAHALLKERLQADLPVVALLQYPTIRALARYLTHGRSGAATPHAAIDRAQKQREALMRQRTLAGKR